VAVFWFQSTEIASIQAGSRWTGSELKVLNELAALYHERKVLPNSMDLSQTALRQGPSYSSGSPPRVWTVRLLPARFSSIMQR
jgi:hypothetical protein